MRPLFTAAVGTSAFLLFLIQPMIAKMIVPKFGGAPAVWNTCMVFFQAMLLAGYAYAHFATSRLGVRRQAIVHVLLLALPLAALPVAVADGWAPPGDANPIPRLLGLLAITAGLPFFVVSASAPLLQRWFANTGHVGAKDPYFLYAASNVGSLAALLGYPIFIEPLLPLRAQGRLWTAGYLLLAALVGACALALWLRKTSVDREASEDVHDDGSRPWTSEAKPITMWRRLHWIALALVPSSLMLGVTTHITTDIAPVPLLWVLPLTLYLLSFVLTFSGRLSGSARMFAWVLPIAVLISAAAVLSRWPQMALHLVLFFAAAMACHGELARLRPSFERLTEFYLLMSLGGVLGGALNALIAPAIFRSFLEYPLMTAAACMLLPAWRGGSVSGAVGRRLGLGLISGPGQGSAKLAPIDLRDFVWPLLYCGAVAALFFADHPANLAPRRLLAAGACVMFLGRPVRFGFGVAALLLLSHFYTTSQVPRLYQERSFFGMVTVTNDAKRNVHWLIHGTTEHGAQNLHENRNVRRLPRLYYDATGPIGQVFMSDLEGGVRTPVAVIGLGAGSLASYAEKDQEFTFFEIDPAIERIARNPEYFTYLSECKGRLRVVLGDARLSLVHEPDHHFGLIVVDAFSSDAIPTHLITREALQLYRQKLSEGGILAFHISNEYLDLEPVLDGLARAEGLAGLSLRETWLDMTEIEKNRGKKPSHWVLLANRPEDFDRLKASRWYRPWQQLPARADSPLWTDDFSNLIGVLRWK
jgi:hypothetical protein